MSKHEYLARKNGMGSSPRGHPSPPLAAGNSQQDAPEPPTNSTLQSSLKVMDFSNIGGTLGTIPTSLADEDEAWLNDTGPSKEIAPGMLVSDLPPMASEKLLVLEETRQALLLASQQRKNGSSE